MTGDLLLFAAFLVPAAVLAGLLAGLLGVGGGIVIVPMLFWLFEIRDVAPGVAMAVAVGTSLATIIPTALVSARSHRAKGNFDAALFRKWSPFIFGGALLGGLLSFVLDGEDLQLLFGVIALAVAVNMAIPKTFVLTRGLPDRWWKQAPIAGGIGAVSALMGIGGGTLSVPILSLFGYPTHRAVGTAAAFGFVIAVPAMLGFIASGWSVADRPPWSLGYVNIPTVALIIPITTLVAPIGARLAHALPAARLKLIFASFLGVTSLRMLWNALA